MKQALNKTFNLYCDESCHLEKDGTPYMLIGYVSCAYNQVKLHHENIRKLKEKHNVHAEVKWSRLSRFNHLFYTSLIEYFFATDLQYRAIVIEKCKLKHEAFHQSHDDFYYKMYFQLLNKKISPEYNYNIYLDIKDSNSAKKVNGLKEYLNKQYLRVRTLQNIRSHESQLMQLTDLITGALSYYLRGFDKVIAKNKIIEKIKSHSHSNLDRSSSFNNEKFNLFFIDLK